jgi:hypothetical protein
MNITTNTKASIVTTHVPCPGESIKFTCDMIAWVCHKMELDDHSLYQIRNHKDFVEFSYYLGESTQEELEKVITSLVKDFRYLSKEEGVFDNQVKVYWITEGLIPSEQYDSFIRRLKDLPPSHTHFTFDFKRSDRTLWVEGGVAVLTLTRGALGWEPVHVPLPTAQVMATKSIHMKTTIHKAPIRQPEHPQTDRCVKHNKVFPKEGLCPECHLMSTQLKEGTDRRRGLDIDPNSPFEKKLRALTNEMHKCSVPMVGRVKIEGCDVPGSQIIGYKCRRHGDLGETYHCDAYMRMNYCESHNEVYPAGVSCCPQCFKSTPF